jgi:MFS family permease
MIRKVKESESGPILGWKPVIALSVCNSAHFYSLCSIFSYAGFLAVDCGWAPDRDRSGYVAGLLPTAVLVGRLFTSISWGYAADRIGRRPAMIASMAAVALGNLAFGFATNIYVAIGVRLILLGMCNGWVSLMGMCTLEVAGEAYQTQVFSYIISVGSVTATLGPAIAGWTYGVLGVRFPALAPSLVGFGLGIVAVAVTYAWLPETVPARKGAVDGSSEEGTYMEQSATRTPTRQQQKPLRAALCTHPFPLVMFLRSGHGMAMFAAFDVVPLWAIATARAGGLALVEEEVGSMLAVSSFLQFLFTVSVMGALVRRLGLYCSLVLGCALGGACMLLFPLISDVGSSSSAAAAAAAAAATTTAATAAATVAATATASVEAAVGANASDTGTRGTDVTDSSGSTVLATAAAAAGVPSGADERYWQAAAAAAVYAVQSSAMLLGGTSLVSMSNVLCARDPSRSGALNGIVAFTEGIGKMLGPALAAPLLAIALSTRPAATSSPSGVLLVFVGLGVGIGSLALLGLIGLPRRLTNDVHSVELARPSERFAPLEEEREEPSAAAPSRSAPSH